jgi:hypothetical protein
MDPLPPTGIQHIQLAEKLSYVEKKYYSIVKNVVLKINPQLMETLPLKWNIIPNDIRVGLSVMSEDIGLSNNPYHRTWDMSPRVFFSDGKNFTWEDNHIISEFLCNYSRLIYRCIHHLTANKGNLHMARKLRAWYGNVGYTGEYNSILLVLLGIVRHTHNFDAGYRQ